MKGGAKERAESAEYVNDYSLTTGVLVPLFPSDEECVCECGSECGAVVRSGGRVGVCE
jgi:hypothetical protein